MPLLFQLWITDSEKSKLSLDVKFHGINLIYITKFTLKDQLRIK